MSDSVIVTHFELHHAQGRGPCPGEPVPVPDHHRLEELFPNNQPEQSSSCHWREGWQILFIYIK